MFPIINCKHDPVLFINGRQLVRFTWSLFGVPVFAHVKAI